MYTHFNFIIIIIQQMTVVYRSLMSSYHLVLIMVTQLFLQEMMDLQKK